MQLYIRIEPQESGEFYCTSPPFVLLASQVASQDNDHCLYGRTTWQTTSTVDVQPCVPPQKFDIDTNRGHI